MIFHQILFHIFNVVPLHIACREGHHEVVKVLLKDDIDTVNIESGTNCKTPLHYACEKGDKDIVDLLLESGAQKNAQKNIVAVIPYM